MGSRVTAVVLNWCAEEDTAACVESLIASTNVQPVVLIVDNASPDGSGERLRRRFPDLPFLSNRENVGYAGGNNLGIAWALEHGCDYILVVNDDAVLEPDCLRALVDAADKTDAAAVAPQIRYFSEPEVVACGAGSFSQRRALGVHRDYVEAKAVPSAPQDVTFLSGCCVLLRADAVRRLGAFDASYFAYVEDAELSYRYVKAGERLIYVPSAQAFHKAERGRPDSAFQIRQRDRNRRRLVRRHYGIVERLSFGLWFYPTRLVHLVRYAARGDWTRARALIEGTFGSLGDSLQRERKVEPSTDGH